MRAARSTVFVTAQVVLLIAVMVIPGGCAEPALDKAGPPADKVEPVPEKGGPLVDKVEPVLDYVARPDAAFSWQVVARPADQGGQNYNLAMTSQVWQGITWKHRVLVTAPAKPKHPDWCVLVITGGNPAGEMSAFAALTAGALGCPVAVLGDIPNQPLFDGLREDALIAYTFTKYLVTGDTSWPLLFPMTKSAVRAMDCLQAFSEKEWGKRVQRFLVTGASKRGWTTWFTGVVDSRAAAIMPMVYNNLNLPAQMRHQREQFGDYSEQIDDYTKLGLPDLLASSEGQKLGRAVDPYTYRDRTTMPKLIIAGTNDPYWPVDAAGDYFNDLVGPRYLLHVPNSGHGLDDRRTLLSGMWGFASAILGDASLPKLDWQFATGDQGLTITATCDPAPVRVLVWKAESATKDFRKAKWTSEQLPQSGSKITYTLAKPAKGYAAMYLEFVYQAGGRDWPLTSEIHMVGP